MGDAIAYVTTHWDSISMTVLALIGAASAIAKLTPTQTDDNAIAAFGRFFGAIGLNTTAHHDVQK